MSTCVCGAAVPEGSRFCPTCGKDSSGGAAPVASTTSGGSGLTDNVAGGLCYVTIIPAIIFLIMEPYNRNKFIRFHAWQSIFLTIAAIVVNIGVSIVGGIGLGWIAYMLIEPLISIIFLVAWLVCLINAFQNKKFKLPVIGDLAEKQA